VQLSENIWIASRSLRSNKARSFLTMLGIIIGVTSMVTMVAVGSGAETQVAQQIRSLGSNVLMVVPGAARQGGVQMAGGSRVSLTEADGQAIVTQVPGVKNAAPSIHGSSQIVRKNRNWNTTVNGTTSDYFQIREWETSAGRLFVASEVENGDKVAVLGAMVAKQLFAGEDPLGGEIRIQNVPFQVVGVLAEKGQSGTGQIQDDIVFVPITAARLRLFGGSGNLDRESVGYVLVKAASDDDMEPVRKATAALLRQRHRLAQDRDDDFQVNDPAAAMALQHASTRTLALLLASVAAVSIIVGGISIMNIMLVSVTERTREIGLRLAVGARRSDIRNQFLTEAGMLCVIGGMIGIAAGVATSWAIAQIAGWPILLSPDSMVLAVVFSGLVGCFFGYYPAQRAARLAPVDALRTE
jgi:putative ABC transport system permease protein